MKKLTRKLWVLLLVGVLAMSVFAFAACDGGTVVDCSSGHVDANSDGVCDNCKGTIVAEHTPCEGHVDANGDGKCDLCGDKMYVAPAYTAPAAKVVAFEKTIENAKYYYDDDNDASTEMAFEEGTLNLTVTLNHTSNGRYNGSAVSLWEFDGGEFEYTNETNATVKVTNDEAAGSSSLAWNFNADYPTWENLNVIYAYVDGGGAFLMQKVVIAISTDATGMTFTTDIALNGANDIVSLEYTAEKVATLTGSQDFEFMAGIPSTQTVSLTLYENKLAESDFSVSAMGATVGYEFFRGTYGGSAGNYNVKFFNGNEFDVTKGAHDVLSANIVMGWAVDATTVSYDPADITLSGTGEATNPMSEYLPNVPVTVDMLVNMRTKTATLSVNMLIDMSAMGLGIMAAPVVPGAAGTIADGASDDEYIATFNWTVDYEGTAIPMSAEITFTVSNGVYTATVPTTVTGATEAITITFGG